MTMQNWHSATAHFTLGLNLLIAKCWWKPAVRWHLLIVLAAIMRNIMLVKRWRWLPMMMRYFTAQQRRFKRQCLATKFHRYVFAYNWKAFQIRKREAYSMPIWDYFIMVSSSFQQALTTDDERITPRIYALFPPRRSALFWNAFNDLRYFDEAVFSIWCRAHRARFSMP